MVSAGSGQFKIVPFKEAEEIVSFFANARDR